MKYEDFDKQPNPTCECDLLHARSDGNKRCGAPVHKMHDGRYMCEGHYSLARQKEESMAQVKRDMKAWESRKQHSVPSNGKDWAYRILAKHESGESVPSISLQMAQSVVGRQFIEGGQTMRFGE